MNKISIYHFHNGSGGGVLSVIKNLLRFSTNSFIDNHIIHAVNKDVVSEYIIEPIEGATSQQVVYYTGTNNFYHSCKQMAKALPGEQAILVAHDWIELGMASNLGLQNKVVYVLHGDFDYYYELAEKHSEAIDAFVCISPRIAGSLKKRLPHRVADIFYLNFPVQEVEAKSGSTRMLRIIYYVNNLKEDRKQFATVIEIARQLADAADEFFFTIAGGGMTTEEFFKRWPVMMKGKVNYKGFQTNEAMLTMLPHQDVFLLPSLAEGFPVSLAEAMKAGLVPLVTDWEGAVNDLVIPGITGYYFKPGAVVDYTACIKNLQQNRQLLDKLSDNSMRKANALFNPINNTRCFEALYTQVVDRKSTIKRAVKVYGSRLDAKLLPNWFTKFIRQVYK